MDIISVAVCDDEIILLPQLAAMIRDYFLQAGFTPEVDSYADAAGLLRDVYSRKRHDVYFLDIDIPEHSGIEIAERIAEVYPDAVLCFVSGQEDRILDTFHVRPVAFVRKSCFSEDIVRALSTIKKKLHKPEERMASLFKTPVSSKETLCPITYSATERSPGFLEMRRNALP